jgi:hypothetical protein
LRREISLLGRKRLQSDSEPVELLDAGADEPSAADDHEVTGRAHDREVLLGREVDWRWSASFRSRGSSSSPIRRRGRLDELLAEDVVEVVDDGALRMEVVAVVAVEPTRRGHREVLVAAVPEDEPGRRARGRDVPRWRAPPSADHADRRAEAARCASGGCAPAAPVAADQWVFCLHLRPTVGRSCGVRIGENQLADRHDKPTVAPPPGAAKADPCDAPHR